MHGHGEMEVKRKNTTLLQIYSNVFEKSKIENIEIWDQNNVIDNVIKAVKEAKKNF